MPDDNGHGVDPERPPAPEPWADFNLTLDKKGRPHLNLDNLDHILARDPALRNIAWFDTFHQRIFTSLSEGLEEVELDPFYCREWTDADDLRLTAYIQRTLKLPTVSDELVRKAVNLYAKLTPRNEPREWMDSLKWDRTFRIDNFLTDAFGVAPSLYARAVSKNFFIAMAARIYRPGCKVDNVVVFEGAQGIGKSKILAALGGKWYLDWSGDIYDKDFYLALQGKLLVEFSELDTFGKADATKIKAVITCMVDQYRAPYEARSQSHPRQCIFVGSTNECEWIKDQTGGRRFWPVTCGADDSLSEAYVLAHRDQLFAEAVARFKGYDDEKPETWWEVPDTAAKEQEERRVSDELEPEVASWLHERPGGISIFQLAEGLDMTRKECDMKMQWRLGACAKRAGWRKKSTPFGKLWYPLKIQQTPLIPLEKTEGGDASA